MDPEIVLGADEREVEAPPLTPVPGGVLERRETEARKEGATEAEAGRKWTWKFWKRPSRRVRELEELRRGCDRLAGVMGTIRDEMVVAKSDRARLDRSLSPLPVAVKGLQRVGETQERTNQVLGGVKKSLDRAAEKDAVFFKTMDRVGDTMAHMDMAVVGMGRSFSSIERTNRQSVQTMERLSERLDTSDRFLEQAFVRLRDTEQEFAQHMVVNSRRSALVTVTVCLLLTLGIAVLAHTLGGAKPHVTVLRSIPFEETKPVEEMNGVVPFDWEAQVPDGSGLAETRWPLDFPGATRGGDSRESTAEGRLLFVNKLPDD